MKNSIVASAEPFDAWQPVELSQLIQLKPILGSKLRRA
jgi:hypothetical protein